MKTSLRLAAMSLSGLALVIALVATAHAQEGSGNALRFDGSGDSMIVNHTAALNAFPLSVTTWVKTAQNTSFPPIVAKLVAGVSNGWQVYLRNGNVRARYFADAASFLSGNDGGLPGGLDGGFVADDVFHHVAFTVDAAGGNLYVDGVLRDSRAWVGTPGAPTATELIRLGLHNNISFVGMLDEVTIWNVALTGAEIQNNMRRSLAGSEPGLIAYYRFNETSGVTAADSAPADGNNQGAIGGPARIVSPLALAPSVATFPASALTQTSATLNGSVNPNNATTSAHFEWGFTTSYGNVTPAQALGSGNAPVAFSEPLAGLTPGVSHHFRAVATNSFGTTFGADQTFPSLAQRAYLKASNTGGGDLLGWAVALSGDTLVAGAIGEDSNATGANGDQANNSVSQAGAVFVFVRSGDSWVQQAYLKASNPGVDDYFGTAVAISGDTLVVGAGGFSVNVGGEDSDATGVNGDGANNNVADSGAAYVFVRNGTTWTQQAYLKASNTGAGDRFGLAIAVAGDLVVVGAPLEDSNATGINGNQNDSSAADAGAAYVFARSGTTWTQQAYLKASNTSASDRFGFAVAASGETVIVGGTEAPTGGAAYVFVRNGTTWSQQAVLTASNAGANDFFGNSVAISGESVVVGATGEDSNATGVNGDGSNNSATGSGAAYVFLRSGTTWTQQAYLKASNTEMNDIFGRSVAITGDRVVVGADGEDSNATGINGTQANNSASSAGAAYIFTRAGTTWSPQDYVKASNTEAFDAFGYSVAAFGDTVVAGAWGEGSNATGINGNQNNNNAGQSGAAYVFGPPLPPVSEISVAVNVLGLLTDIADGGASPQIFSAGANPATQTFVMRNLGNGPLTGFAITFDGPDAALFSVATAPAASVAPGGLTGFTIRFASPTTGTRSAVLHLANNDADENPFDITLSARALSFTEDTDGDGLNDASELQLASLGFNFQSSQTGLVNTLFNNATGAGLFTENQVEALHVDVPLLMRDAGSGLFTLTIELKKSVDLIQFAPFPFTGPGTTIDAQGRIKFQFSVPDDAAFLRLQSQP